MNLLNSGNLKQLRPDIYDQALNFYRTYLEIDKKNGHLKKAKSPSKTLARGKSPPPDLGFTPPTKTSVQSSTPRLNKATSPRATNELKQKKSADYISTGNLEKWAKLTEALLEQRHDKLIRKITRNFLTKLENRGRWPRKDKSVPTLTSMQVINTEPAEGSVASSLFDSSTKNPFPMISSPRGTTVSQKVSSARRRSSGANGETIFSTKESPTKKR